VNLDALNALVMLGFAWADPAPLTPATDAYPSLSPDGRTLLFQSNRSGRWALYFADPDGRNLRMFLDSGDDPVVATWSPDGKRIAFAANVGAMPEIFVIDRDGRHRRRLTDHAGDDSHPHWSADGERVFFNSSRTTPDPAAEWSAQWHEIFSIRADGGDLRQHTHCKAVCTYGVPSPDGNRLAYRKILATPGLDWALRAVDTNSEVFVADIDGRHERNLTSHGAYDGWPVWSPDGKALVISSARTGKPNAGQLFAIDVESGHATALTESSDYGYVQPSFAGSSTLYASRMREAPDWSWEYGHIVRLPIVLPSPSATAAAR
jgi:TolB protein